MEELLSLSATHVTSVIQNLIPEYCHGCIVDHPSQHQHNLCLMMEWLDQVLTLFNEAYDNVDLSTFYYTIRHDCGHIFPESKCFQALWKETYWRGLVQQWIFHTWTKLRAIVLTEMLRRVFIPHETVCLCAHVFRWKGKSGIIFSLDHADQWYV